MISYNEIKKTIKSPLFMEEFYNTYVEERAAAARHLGDGNSFSKIKEMEFFSDPECDRFLEVINESLPSFTFKYYDGGRLSYKLNGRFLDIDEAYYVAAQIKVLFKHDSCEVTND